MRKLFIVLIAIFSFSCSKDDNTTNSNPIPITKDIYPLAVGNQWIFKNNITSEIDTITITSSFDSNGDKIYAFYGYDDFSFDFDNPDQGFFYRDKDLWTYMSGIKKLFIPYTRVNGYVSLRSDSVKTLTILSTNETVTVPAGTFNCYKYYYVAIYQGSTGKYYWLADGIGVVKLQHENSSEADELITYTLK